MKQKRLTPLLLVIALLTAMPVAQAGVYSLDECIQLSLKNNLQIKNGNIDQQSVRSTIQQAKSNFLPSVDITGQYQYYLSMPKMLVPAELFGGPKGTYAEMSFGSEQTSGTSLQVSQVLFNQKVFIGLRAAKTARNLTDIQVSKTREDLVYNVSAVYYNLQVLEQSLNLLDSNLVVLEKILNASSVLQANEIVSKTSLKRVQISFENLKNERSSLQLTNDKTYNLLKFLLGVSLDQDVRINAFQEFPIHTLAESMSIEQRTDVQLLKEQIQLAELDKKATVAEFYPSLSGVYNYGITGYYDKVSPFKTFNDRWIKSSYIGLQLNIPVFSGGRRYQSVKQKDFDLQKARNNYDLVRQSAQKDLADAVSNYQSTVNSYENSKRSLGLASDVFNSSFTEYKNGLLSLTDLLQIQNDLTTARNNYTTALIKLRIAGIELEKAQGTLLSNVEKQ